MGTDKNISDISEIRGQESLRRINVMFSTPNVRTPSNVEADSPAEKP
jgi:hypothetical protein